MAAGRSGGGPCRSGGGGQCLGSESSVILDDVGSGFWISVELSLGQAQRGFRVQGLRLIGLIGFMV